VDGLIKKHDGFTTTLEAQREKITTLEQLCQALLAQNHHASEQIKSRCDGVLDRMGRVVQMTESRRLRLLESRSYQQFLCNTYEVLNSVLLFFKTRNSWLLLGLAFMCLVCTLCLCWQLPAKGILFLDSPYVFPSVHV